MAEETATPETEGAFMESLVRTNKQIKHDRAESIAEDAQLRFKRTVEDMEMEMKKLERERRNMLDLSPTNTQSLIVADEFDSEGFVERDLKLGKDMHNLGIKLDIARKRYSELFKGGA